MKKDTIDQLTPIYGRDLLSELSEDLLKLLPFNKEDVSAAERITALPLEKIEPIIPPLLTWLQDLNWPVAQVLTPYLKGMGIKLQQEIAKILEGNDVMWQYWVLVELVNVPDLSLAKSLEDKLTKIISGDCDPTVKEEAQKIIQKLHP